MVAKGACTDWQAVDHLVTRQLDHVGVAEVTEALVPQLCCLCGVSEGSKGGANCSTLVAGDADDWVVVGLESDVVAAVDGGSVALADNPAASAPDGARRHQVVPDARYEQHVVEGDALVVTVLQHHSTRRGCLQHGAISCSDVLLDGHRALQDGRVRRDVTRGTRVQEELVGLGSEGRRCAGPRNVGGRCGGLLAALLAAVGTAAEGWRLGRRRAAVAAVEVLALARLRRLARAAVLDDVAALSAVVAHHAWLGGAGQRRALLAHERLELVAVGSRAAAAAAVELGPEAAGGRDERCCRVAAGAACRWLLAKVDVERLQLGNQRSQAGSRLALVTHVNGVEALDQCKVLVVAQTTQEVQAHVVVADADASSGDGSLELKGTCQVVGQRLVGHALEVQQLSMQLELADASLLLVAGLKIVPKLLGVGELPCLVVVGCADAHGDGSLEALAVWMGVVGEHLSQTVGLQSVTDCGSPGVVVLPIVARVGALELDQGVDTLVDSACRCRHGRR